MEGFVVVGADFMGEWVETPKCWNWQSKTKTTTPIALNSKCTYDQLIDHLIERGNLTCHRNDLSISYIFSAAPTRGKVAPSFIRNDNDLHVYMLDVGSNGSRPILKIFVSEGSQGGSNAATNADSARPPRQVPFSESAGDAVSDAGAGDTAGDMDSEEENDIEDPEVGNPVGNGSNCVGESAPTQGSNVADVIDDCTGFHTGKTFATKKELVVALKMGSMKKPFTFKTKKSTKSLYVVACVEARCRWRVRAMKYVNSNRFVITKYFKEHTCGVQHLPSFHPHASADVIGEYFKNRFIEGKGLSTKDMKNALDQQLNSKVSYWKCWKGREIAKALVRGSPEHSYAVLDAYCFVLESLNPGSKTGLMVDEQGRFKYLFVSYGAWVRGFTYMRKVISVDGTHLSSTYGGVLLTAVAQDTENHIYPLAFCVVDKECDSSWQYFFEQLAHVVPNTPDLCIISDRAKAIANGIRRVYTLAAHGCCIKHLSENMRTRFKCGAFLKDYFIAAKAYDYDVFKDAFEQLELTCPAAAACLRDEVGFDKWTRAFFPGNRYDVLTTNLSESLNAMFKDEREYPILGLCEAITRRFTDKFNERREEMKKKESTILVPSAEVKMSRNMVEGNKLIAYHAGGNVEVLKYTVVGDGKSNTVNLHFRTCTCREFDLEKIPCKHVFAVLRIRYGDEYGASAYHYTCPYYRMQTYLCAYQENVIPMPPEQDWMVPEGVIFRNILPPIVDPKKGRRRINRFPSVGETFFARRRQNRCSNCKRSGHKRTTCPGLAQG